MHTHTHTHTHTHLTHNTQTHTIHKQNYERPEELWQREADADGSHNSWYKKAVDYWDGQDASYNGVLVRVATFCNVLSFVPAHKQVKAK
jgi:hypothetical protein